MVEWKILFLVPISSENEQREIVYTLIEQDDVACIG